MEFFSTCALHLRGRLSRPTVNHGARAAYLAPHPPELRAAHVDHAGSAADGADRGVDVEQKPHGRGSRGELKVVDQVLPLP